MSDALTEALAASLQPTRTVRHLVPTRPTPKNRATKPELRRRALEGTRGRFDGRNVVFHIFRGPAVASSLRVGAVLSTATTARSWST